MNQITAFIRPIHQRNRQLRPSGELEPDDTPLHSKSMQAGVTLQILGRKY